MTAEAQTHTEATPANTPISTFWPLVSVLAVVAYLYRLLRIPFYDRWVDEEITMRLVTNYDWVWLIKELPEVQPHLPLYYLLLDAWFAVFGAGYPQARVLSAAFGVATLVAAAALGRSLAGNGVGLWTGLLVTMNPFHVYLSTTVRMYSLLSLLTVLSYFALIRLLRQPTRIAATLYTLSALALAYTHYFGYFFVLAQLIILVWRAVRQRSLLWGSIPAAVGVGLLPGLAVMALKVFVSEPRATTFGHATYLSHVSAPPDAGVLADILVRLLVGQPHATVVYIGLAVLVIGILAGARYGSRSMFTQTETVLLASWIIVPVALMVILSYLLFPFWQPRYLIGISLPLFVLFGIGVMRCRLSVQALAAISIVGTSSTAAWGASLLSVLFG